MANTQSDILIAGAGPSGLSLAIFLSELGYSPRIIDKKPAISDYSKALAVNPRTLEIFDKFKMTSRFLEHGRKMPAANIWKNGRLILKNDFRNASHKYPFLLVQPQKESEEILLDEVRKRNIPVEYDTELEIFSITSEGFHSSIRANESTVHDSVYLAGADGAHSVVRKGLQIEYEGLKNGSTWELYDLELELDLPPDDANILLHKEGGLFLIRIRENVWRVAGNLKDLLNYLPQHTRIGRIIWTTRFNVTHLVAHSLVKGNAVLIGDAAHIHSPIGGRGMNLGIEDAYIVSRLIKENRLEEYENLRKSYLDKTVKRINAMTQFMTRNSSRSRLIRNNIGLFKPFMYPLKPLLRNFVLGIS